MDIILRVVTHDPFGDQLPFGAAGVEEETMEVPGQDRDQHRRAEESFLLPAHRVQSVRDDQRGSGKRQQQGCESALFRDRRAAGEKNADPYWFEILACDSWGISATEVISIIQMARTARHSIFKELVDSEDERLKSVAEFFADLALKTEIYSA